MARDIDVFQLVKAFGHRNNLTSIDYRLFAQAVQKQAKTADQANPIFRDLGINPDTVLMPRLLLAAKDKKVALEMSGNEIAKIILPEHYAGVFDLEYRRMEDSPELPFPNEETLGLVVPPEWIQVITLQADLGTLSDSEEECPVPLVRIVFPDSLRPLIVPSGYVPDRLLEQAVLKIRHFLRKGGNKEYLYNKLLYAFSSREIALKEAFSAVLSKPYESIAELKKSSSDLTFPFWAYLVSNIKKDLDKKADKTGEDIAIYQAAVLCEFYANHYKAKAQRVVDLELAFKTLDQSFRKAPYYFSYDDVRAFTDSKGQPLLGKYSDAELEERLKYKTTKAEAKALPELLVLAGGRGNRYYVAKDRLLLLLLKLAGEARPEVRTKVMESWRDIIERFESIPAMDDDDAYRAMLGELLAERHPFLEALLADKILPLVYEECVEKNEAPEALSGFFVKSAVAPLDQILEVPRKTMLGDAKMLLPFWYSVPLFVTLIRLFRRKKSVPKQEKKRESTPESQAAKAPKDRKAEFAQAAAAVGKKLVPAGYSLDEYLRELEGRWNNLINLQAKANLTEDVNSLVRDYLRGILRSMRGEAFTLERVKGLASSLADSPALMKIKNHSALELYIQVYMVKVLMK